MVRYDNACRIVMGSSLVAALHRRYGERWSTIRWVRIMLGGFVGALEGTDKIDDILDEMEMEAGRITGNGTAAA